MSLGRRYIPSREGIFVVKAVVRKATIVVSWSSLPTEADSDENFRSLTLAGILSIT